MTVDKVFTKLPAKGNDSNNKTISKQTDDANGLLTIVLALFPLTHCCQCTKKTNGLSKVDPVEKKIEILAVN